MKQRNGCIINNIKWNVRKFIDPGKLFHRKRLNYERLFCTILVFPMVSSYRFSIRRFSFFHYLIKARWS